MIDAYVDLHRRGFAHSAEAYDGGLLVGGLYGVSLGGVFFGESMYADEPDASKAAFVALVRWMLDRGIDLVDCQVRTDHLERFRAPFSWPRKKYMAELEKRLTRPTLVGHWRSGAEPPPRSSKRSAID